MKLIKKLFQRFKKKSSSHKDENDELDLSDFNEVTGDHDIEGMDLQSADDFEEDLAEDFAEEFEQDEGDSTSDFNLDELSSRPEEESTPEHVPSFDTLPEQSQIANDEVSEESFDDTTGDFTDLVAQIQQESQQKRSLLTRIKSALAKAKDKFQTPKSSEGLKSLLTKLKLNKLQEAAKDNEKINELAMLASRKAKEINWKNLHNEILSPKNFQNVHRGFQHLALFLPFYLLAHLAAILFTPSELPPELIAYSIDESNKIDQNMINDIKKANLFKTKVQPNKGPKKPDRVEIAVCEEATKRSSLGFNLENTIVLQNSKKSLASISTGGPDFENYREGDSIKGQAEIGKIDRLKIIVKNLKTGGCEYIESKEANRNRSNPITVLNKAESASFKKRMEKVSGIETDGNKFVIEKALIKEKLKNIQELLTQARGIQITNPDGSLAFKIVEIQPGSIYSYLGIENNDIITEINGKKISSLNEVMSLFSNLGNLSKLNMTLKRSGEVVPRDYQFK